MSISTSTESSNEFQYFTRYIHFDQEIEKAVLGALFLEKTAYSRVRGIVSTESFYFQPHALVWQYVSQMWEQNVLIDILTVANWMAKHGHSEINHQDVGYFLTTLTAAVVSTAHLEFHALLLRQMYAERKLLEINFSNKNNSADTLVKIKSIQDELSKLSMIKVADDWADMTEIILELYKHMDEVKDKELIGIPTGFRKLDLITGGLVKTNLIIIAARPSVGKSAFLNSLVLHAAGAGYNVGIISLEMPKVQIGARMGSLVSDIDFYKIFRNRMEDEQESEKLHKYLGSLSDLPIKVSTKTDVNVNDIRAKAAQLIYKNKLDILFIDYLQLIESEEGKNYNREQEVSKMSRGLKCMAMEYGIPIVVLAQLNRESEKSANKKPQLHHLRESGSIEQDADGVIFLHRDFKVGIPQDEQGGSTERQADLIVAKWRNGETPEIKIGFDPPKMKFFELPSENYHSLNQATWRPYKEN